MDDVSEAAPERGILASAAGLDRWLRYVMVALVVTCALRYVDRHGTGPTTVLVLLGAAVLAIAYVTRTLVSGRAWWPTAWVVTIVLVWAVLCILAPSFAWCAVPVAFAALQVFDFGWAVATVVAMTIVVSGSWLRITDGVDPTLVVGPIGLALVTVISYRALERESQSRQEVVDRLIAAQADLVDEQHRSGALAERARLSREIHDSIGQGLSSINLLLNAAEQEWRDQAPVARQHVQTAAAIARDGLDDVRRVVRDLADDVRLGQSGEVLEDALRRAVDQAAVGVDVSVSVYGEPMPLDPDVATALLRTTRGALANVREHASASRAAVTLTYLVDEVRLDIRDDGLGFRTRPSGRRDSGLRGRGLSGIRERAVELGGLAEVESQPGEGTTVSVRFPSSAGQR